MKKININLQDGVKSMLYPDNQPHIKVSDVNRNEEVSVSCSITNSVVLMNLLQVSDALDTIGCVKKELHIPYLMGARFDRVIQGGDSFDLRVVSKLINDLYFERVFLYDVHSDVSTALIKNATPISNDTLVVKYTDSDSILICPDAGAAKKIGHYLDINDNIIEVVHCVKTRDLSNGDIRLEVLQPERCTDRNCVIIDDLCDGGGTFLAIGNSINPKKLTLIVTHGIFSRGFSQLDKMFHKIITSDTYPQSLDSKKAEVISWTSF